MILNSFFLAFRQIKRNFLRSLLTMLGIIIGVGSVVIMITLGNGFTKNIADKIGSLGSNLMIIRPTPPFTGIPRKEFTPNEIASLKAQTLHLVDIIAPQTHKMAVAQFRQNGSQTEMQGVTQDYFLATNWLLQSGRNFTQEDYKGGKNVCIIGESAKKNLFKNEEAFGNKIRINNIICECIGVLEAKGQNTFGEDQDNVIMLPLKTFQRNFANKKTLHNIKTIIISLKDGVDSTEASKEITKIFGKIRNSEVNFYIRDSKQILETMKSTTGTMTLFLSAIAGVSLIVGGIGIMNIMLVSITERTKEIGTRLAIGALQSEVLLQFLIEAVTLSSFGGAIGIILAFFISLITCFMLDLPFVFDYTIALIAFVFSAFIGILFGYLPAKRASKLNPIEALRHE